MRKKIFYSIIIPAYNCEETIKITYDSLLNQTFKNFEVIIVNDGSIDNTLNILKGYAKKDKRLIIIDQINQGVSVARNSGLKRSKGDYIIFVDADDYLEKDGIEIINNYLEKNDVDVLKYNYYRSVMNKKKKVNQIFPHETFITNEEFNKKHSIYDKLINTHELSSIWTAAYKRKIIENITFLEGVTYAEDYVFNLQVFEKVKNFLYIDEPIYNYVYNQQSITQIINEQRILRNIDSAKKAYKYLFTFIKKVEIEEGEKKVLSRYALELAIAYTKLINIKTIKEFEKHVITLKKDKYINKYLLKEKSLFYNKPKLYYIKRKVINSIKKIFKIIK